MSIDMEATTDKIEVVEESAQELMRQLDLLSGSKVQEDISYGQYKVISVIHNHGPISVGNLGRLDFELRRAARLVVDTGIHEKGWTRSEAAAYYGEATGSPTDPIAMNRFVVLPGQGCGYTIGMLKILELRQEAIDKLGDKFDIKAFHEVVLGSGSLPLEILEELVTEWLTSEQNN